MSRSQGSTPAHSTAPSPYTGSGKRNTEVEISRGNTYFLEIPNVYVPRHAGAITPVFGFADEHIITGHQLRQENWTRRGLYINYQYVARGVANLIVATTTEEAKERYLRVLERISRKQLSSYQGVLA